MYLLQGEGMHARICILNSFMLMPNFLDDRQLQTNKQSQLNAHLNMRWPYLMYAMTEDLLIFLESSFNASSVYLCNQARQNFYTKKKFIMTCKTDEQVSVCLWLRYFVFDGYCRRKWEISKNTLWAVFVILFLSVFAQIKTICVTFIQNNIHVAVA